MTYRFNIDIGGISTSASYHRAEVPGAAVEPVCARSSFDTVRGRRHGPCCLPCRDASQHHHHRESAARRGSDIGPGDLSSELGSSQLFLLWEALVLAGIPDAVTLAVADPKPLVSAPRIEHEPSEAKTAPLPQAAAPIPKRRWPVIAAIAAIGAGVAAGVIVAGVPRPASLAGGAESRTVSGSPAATQSAPSPIPTRTSQPTRGGAAWTFRPPRRSLHINSWFRVGEMMRLSSTWPASPALSRRVRCRRLSVAVIPGRSSLADRRTIIYITQVTGSLRARAVDGSGDRALIKSPPKNCGKITRASWSPADQSIMVVECRATGRPAGCW